MASGGAEEDDGGIPLDIDNVHMLLQVEHEQIQKRTFTNWINAQLSKRCPPSFLSDLFSDLRDGSQLLDLLEVMSGQPMKRQRGRGVFQQRANIETALNFLKKKSIKLVNINISDVIDGRPSIILGLIWTIILHCHIEELANTLSFSSRHSSLDSLSSLDSWSGSPIPASPVPAGRTSPLHRRFRVSAKKALLMWVRDQCQKVGCSVSVRDFKSSWRSGEAFLAILCSLRPQLVDLSLVRSRSNQENLEEAFHLAERELHIPRLLEPQDVDVKDPDEKSIMTYVAQFLQYSNDMPAPDDHLQLFPLVQPSFLSPENLPAHFTPAVAVSPIRQVSPSERAQEVTCWLQKTYQELSESQRATENSSFAEKYQVFQTLADSFTEQRKPVMTLLAAIRRRPELSQEQSALKTAWDRLEEELQRCKAELDSSLPAPLDSVVLWLQRAEAALTEEGGGVKDHADAAKETRTQQDLLKSVIKEMSHHANILDTYHNIDSSGNIIVPLDKFDEIKRRLTNVRVTAKYQGIKLEYKECRHTVLDLLGRIKAKVQTWKAPCRSQETVLVLLQDWHETVERQGLILILMDSLQSLKEKAKAYTSKAALGEGSQRVTRQVKEAESEAELVTQAVTAVRGMMERVVSAWETYNNSITSLQTWLAQQIHSDVPSPAVGTQDMSEWTSCQAKLNEAGNLLIEVTEPSTSLALAEQLSKVNMQWAECMKRTMFSMSSDTRVAPLCLQMVHSLTQEASQLLRQPLEVASVPLKAYRQKLQLLSKKIADVDLSSLSSTPDLQLSHLQKLQQTLPQTLAEAERTCAELQRAASTLEGRLAELDHWSTEALDCHVQLKEKKHRGRPALETTAKVLVSRGLRLESQVVNEGQDLQQLVARVQKTSPLQQLGTSVVQERISEAVSNCQDIFGIFGSLGFLRPDETAGQTQRQAEAGLLVVARTKHVDQVGNVRLQSQDSETSAESSSQTTRGFQHMSTQDEPIIVIPHVQIQMLPQPLRELAPHTQPPLYQTVKEAEPIIQPQSVSKSHTQATSQSQSDQLLPASLGPRTPNSPVLSSLVPEEKEGSSPAQTQALKSRRKGKPNTLQSNKTSPQPPVMVRSEVHSKAQSMARSRLEKARFRLQGRIQQAMKLFGGKEISESQTKKKQRALKILQPVILEEFLCAVEGLGAFCTGPQLQDLMLLSDSVRKQWEDVRGEMAAFVSLLLSTIREGEQCLSVVPCETQTNTLHDATDQTDADSLQQQQAVVDGAASAEERVETLQELCETLTPRKSSILATDQLRESDEAQETQPDDTVLPSDCRGQQLQGNSPLRATGMSADTQQQQGNNLPHKQSAKRPQRELSPVESAVSVQLHGDVVQLGTRGAPTESEDDLTQRGGCGSVKDLKPALRAKEQPLKVRVMHIAESSQKTPTQIQAVVRGNTVETKQEAEWTVITEADPPPQEELPSIQEVLQRYRKSCLVFQSQLQENKQHLEEFIPEPNTDSALQNCKRQLQTLKQETDARWFDFELQYAQLSQRSHLMTREDKGEVERDWEQLTQQWRAQQMCLQSRMASVERSADLIESAGDQIELMTQKLDQILKDPVDISSFTLADTTLVSDLKEMDDRLQSEMRQQSERDTKEERKGPNATSPSPLCPARRNSVHHLEQLRQRLEQVQSAAWALDRFLATIREVKAEIPMLLAKPDPSRQQNEADWEQHRHSWQTALQQKLQTVAEQSDRVDSTLKAVGLSLTMDGAAVTCQDVVTSLSQQAVDGGKEPMRVRKKERKDDLFPVGKEQIQELNPLEICQIKNGDDSPQGHPTPSRMEEESWMRAKRNRLQGGTEAQREEGAETWKSDGGLLEATDQRGRRISQEKGGGEEKESLVQRRAALLDALREIKEAAEQLRLQEPTLPALQQSTRALTDLKNHLAGHLAELQHVRDASSQSDDSQTREVEEAQEEATKAVHERLERCEVLTELLKRFQSLRGELSGTLQRAESTISEQASYMGRDNLHRLHTKVQETKAELSGLGDGIEEVRSVCRQLHMHLRQIPECTAVPFEGEADALMDRWLDISERTDSHIENLHLGLTLWDGILKLGAEVESWSANKLAVFAECPSFQREEDIRALQNEIAAQEENMERFHRKAAEIQALLQSTEPPLELQVVETQLRKKIEQLRELASEAEDVYRQMVAAKGQITARMAECFNSLQKIQDSLLTLSAPDVATVLAKLKDLLFELQAQDEQAESLLEDLRVMASIASPVSLQSLSADANQLQDKVRNTHQLFSEVEEQTQRNIQALDRLQREREHLEQWLQAVENKAAKEEDLSLLQEEALQQRVRTEAISQLVSSLQSSTLRQSPLVEESSKLLERYDNFQTNRLPGSMEKQSSAQGVCSRLEEGVCSQEHFGKLLQDCHLKLASLQERLSACQSQEDSGPGLITALEAFLQELTETEKDLLQIETLKDSIATTSAAETQTELLQQVSNLQNHKRALDSSIREDLARLTANNNQRVQQVEEEMFCVQRELKDLTEKFEHLSGNQDDISQLKQQWHTMQEFDARLTELAVRVNDLQKTTDLSVTHETLPAGVGLTVDAATKDLDSLRSISLQKKQQCAENTTNRVREVVRQLQKWSETVQDELSSHSQAALDEGSGHQQALREVLSERDFLLNCLGTNVTEDLEKSASDALKQSTSAAETLTKHLVSTYEVERDKDKESSETDATYQTLAECPPPCNFLSATDSKENSRSDENGYKVEAKSTLETAKEDAFVPHQDAFKSKPQQNSQRLISNPLKTNLKMDEEVTFNAGGSPLSNGHGTLSGNNTVQVRSDWLPTVNKSLTAQQETIEPLQEGPTSAAEADNTNKINSAPYVTTLVESKARNPDNFPSAPRGNVSQLPAAQSETVKAVRDTEEREKRCEDDSVTPKKVFTIMLDIEPEDMQRNENVSQDASRCFPGAVVYDAQSETFKAVGDAEEQEKWCEDESVTPKRVFTIVLDIEPEDMQRNENVSEDAGRCFQGAMLCDTQSETFKVVADTQEEEKSCEDISDEVSPERKSESDETDLKIHHLKSTLKTSQVAESLPENPLASVSTELDAAKPTSAKLSHMESQEAQKLTHSDVLNPSKSCVISAESHFTGAHATETTLPGVKLEQLTDVCQAKEQTMSSVLSYAEGDAAAEKQTPAGDSKRLSAADAAQDAATGRLQKTEEASEPESQKSKPSNLPKKRVKATMLIKGRKLNVPVLLGDSEVTSGQHQIQGSMEPERTAPGSTADLPAEETLGGSPESDKHECSMQGILSEIQSLVERSNIINRTPHVDLNWYLKSSPGEPEIRLVRTVQKVLACRYQPAQLDVAAMAKQLQDAEDFRGSVQEQAATIKSVSAVGICDADALKSLDGQCSAALLDASATVQVKAAQLDQVKQYHKQMRIIRALLEVLSAERDKMSLNALGSSAIQADKLHALLQTMVRKKDKMEELLHLSSQLSVHLSNAESSGTLLAQLGDVQEEWRLLEGRIKRALQHASSSTCQSSLLIKQAEQLKAKLEALQKSSCESQDGKSALEIVCLSTDLKLYNQLYLHLTSQSDALVRFSLGQKEKDEIKRSLQELGSLLNVTKSKLSTSVHSGGGISSAKLNKQLHDLIVWAKQAENHISIGQKLALFPEEARIQISEMRKFQTDIWSRRSRMQAEVEQMKDLASDMAKEESDQVWKTVEELYEAIADSLDHVLDTMKKNLHEREKLLCQLASLDAWLAETHAKRDPCAHVDSVSRADIRKLESKLQGHKLATGEIETQVRLVEAMAESSRELAAGLSPGESRYLVNRLSGLWTELDGLLAHEKATSWELEELIHERTSSDEELSNIQASLQQISTDLEKQKFPLTQENLSTISRLKHMLMEHQCEVQELQHCQEAKRSSLLCTIGELQDQCKTLSVNAFEQDKYLHLRRQMEESRDIAKEQIERAKDKTINLGERFKLCQTLLVELPLVKTQCQEAADQLEAIAQDLYPSELSSERHRIRLTVETLVSWEYSLTADIKNLESKLLLGLRFPSELPALMELFQRTRVELKGAKPVDPDEKAVDIALRRCWVIWRNMESGMRVLEGLGQKGKVDLGSYKELYALKDAVKQECHSRMESLSQARESLKDYQWAAQGAIGFLHNAEATFLSAPGGFLDCTEEQRQTQQALEALEEGFQAHISHLTELLPQQPCLSRPKTEQLHISILSQLLVGRATLEAQAQLRLESLQRCETRQQSHRKCHEDVRQHLSGLEAKLSDCAAEQVTSYVKCISQQKRAKLLMEDLRSLAGKIEELRAGCPMQGCGVGKDGELGALWRRWVSLRRGAGLLMANTEQRGEEWKDITTSMEQCCSFLASLQAEVPDSSTVSFTQEEPQELLAQAEMHQAGLEQGQQALASLEHRLEHALSLSSSQDLISPGPVGKTLVKIQENVKSLKERNLQVLAAAQAEERERLQVQKEMGEVEQHVFAILSSLEACSNPREKQELRKDLSSQKAKLKSIAASVQSRYAEIPADISRRLQEVQLSLQIEEDKLMGQSYPVRKLNSQVVELGSGLEKVKVLLEQKSQTVNEAQNVLKRVWDELDAWHSRLMLLENEVQDLAEDHPDQAHLLMDQLTQPLQLYQNAAQMAEQRTAFLSKIPACLQEFDSIVHGATCWLDEAQAWLSAPCCFTTARSLQNHANSLQLVLDDSERIRHALQDFKPVLDEISAVCDMSAQEEKLKQNDQQVHKMQSKVVEPLEQLLQAVGVVEAVETELKTMEKNVPKIRAILSSMDDSNITLTEHLQNRQVILANMQSMRRTLEDMERCKGELHLPHGAEESLLVFSRAKQLLQPLEELEQLTQQQVTLLENKISEENHGTATDSGTPENIQQPGSSPQRLFGQEAFEVSNSEEEEDEESASCHSSSSDTLTCSIPEDPEETLNTSDVQLEDIAEVKPLLEVKVPGSGQPPSEVERSLKAGTGLKTKVPENFETGFTTMDSKAGVGKAFNLEAAAEKQFVSAADASLDQPNPETLVTHPHTKSLRAAPAVEDTRLIPDRPITPFTATRASYEIIDEGDEDLSPTTALRRDRHNLEPSYKQLCILDEFELEQCEVFPSLKDVPSLEQCVLGRHLRESPGEKAKLQQSSRSLLQGITRLLDLGEECITEGQMSRVHSRSRLQAALCRRKKLLWVLRSQLAFVQHLFQREPEALRCQEDERLQLEVRAKALQQQALEQEVASQRRVQVWTHWEDNCGRLGRMLEDAEAFISSGDPEGDDEKVAQHRLETCQQTLIQLDDSRAVLGLILDQGKELQTEPGFAATVAHAGGALKLRWQSACNRTEQEIQRCRKIRDSRVRFQTHFASVSEWLIDASKHLKTWSDLANTSDLNQESIYDHLIKLLDFSMEAEAMSVKRASASKGATQLLHLREADCPELRAQLAQLEVNWSQLTSDLPKIQDQLQQRLLAVWPPVELLSDLEDWLKRLETRLSTEKESLHKATDDGQITETLQHYKELNAGLVNGQLLLDFLCQSGPRVVPVDDEDLRSESTMFAEKLGALRLQWLHLQRELESQIREAEQMHHTSADRARRLQRLRGWTEQQKKQLNQRKHPTGQTLARKTLLELEAVVGRAKDVTAALQKLKTTRVCVDKGKDHPCDISFVGQTESVCQDCGDLTQQMEALRPALQQTVEQWGCFERELGEVSLHTTRVRCALYQHQPLFSPKQAEGYMDGLQLLQEQAGKGEELWASVDRSFQSLVKGIHRGTAQALGDQMQEERKRWKEAVQELENERMKTAVTVSLWQKYAHLSDQRSHQLQNLRHQWEELMRSPPTKDTQAALHSVEPLQVAAEDLQSSVGDVLTASKPLIGRLEPVPANLIQSETRLLSRDVLLLSQATSGKKKSLQEDLDQQKLFQTRLEALEKQTQSVQSKLKSGLNDTDSLEQVLAELSGLFASLVDVSEMSGCETLNNQEAARLRTLRRQWVENMTHTLDMNRDLQVERQRSQSFQEKCENLKLIQKKLEESTSKSPQSYTSLHQMLEVHQRLQAEIITGHQLLQAVLCQTGEAVEKEKGEKRSELMAQVTRMRESWFSAVAVFGQRRSLIKEELRQWRIYRRGSKLLQRLLRDVEPLLPPAGPALCALHQPRSCGDDCQCVEDALHVHATVYAQTLEAGGRLCETMTESEQSELQNVQETWKRANSQLERRRDLVDTTVQKWSQCQDGITGIKSELNELETKLKQPLPERRQDSEDEKHIQDTELSLQRLTSGLRELATMKTDLSQYIAAGDSGLLEQQLEQLHAQWEELCMKVSLRRQEIADRLNAWTIFNDKNKEFCDWLTQMENKVCHSGDLSIEEMVEKLKKDCMEEINLFSENKSHLKQLGEQLLLASDEAKQTQVHGSLLEVNQRWHNLFHHIEARVKKLKETLVTVQQLDKNMSNLRSWLCRMEAELSRPITYSVCHHQEIQRRLAEQQELQRDIEQHTEGVASVLSLCDVLLRDEDAAGGTEAESDSLQETSRSLDQRWRTICAMALDRRLRIEETWRLWCKFLDDYSRFEDWLKMAERTAANPNSADVLYTVAKEELKKFEGFQRQVHERLTQLELVNNQYRRLARENRTDRASQLKAMVHEGNRRWDTLHRRVASILRRLKYFTSQREDFEGTRESMLVWLTELDLQLTNVEHFSESDVHHKIQQLNSFQKEITLNTERIDGLIVFGEGLIQRSSPQDAALIEDELEELHSYCQEVFSRLVRFHQRLSQPPMIKEEPELSGTTFSLAASLELICRPWLGRSQGSLPATPTHLLTSPMERSGRETPVSVDSLPLEWDHTVDVGGSSSHEDDEEEEEEEDEEERTYFSALSEVDLTESPEEFVEAPEALRAASLASSRSLSVHESPRWRSQTDAETRSLQLDSEGHTEAPPTLTSTPLKPGYLRLMSQCSGSIEDIKRVSLILDDEEQPEELGLTGLTALDKQSGVIERWELLQAQSRTNLHTDSQEPRQLTSDLDDITSWLENMIPTLECLQQYDPSASVDDMAGKAKELKEMHKMFAHYKSIMLSVNLRAQEAPELQERVSAMNRDWSRACTGLQQWDTSLREKLMRCQEFHETLHSLLLWLAHAESRRYAVDISNPETPVRALQQHRHTLTSLQEELQGRQTQQASLQALWSQLQPEEEAEESEEAREKLHVTGSKLRLLLRQVEQDLSSLQQRLVGESAAEVPEQGASAEASQEASNSKKASSTQREKRDSSPPRSLFYRVLRAAFPLHLLFLFLLLLPCLIPLSESEPACTGANNFARSFYPMLRYTNGPPPT